MVWSSQAPPAVHPEDCWLTWQIFSPVRGEGPETSGAQGSELVSVVHVRVVVFGDHHSVGELAAGESLHGFLAVAGRNVLHEYLQGHKRTTADQ